MPINDVRAGQLFVCADSGCVPLKELENIDLGADLSETEDQTAFRLSNLSQTLECSFELVSKAASRAVIALLGLQDAIMMCCPNKRIVHLAKHGRSYRVRKKNKSRILKTIEKQIKRGEVHGFE